MHEEAQIQLRSGLRWQIEISLKITLSNTEPSAKNEFRNPSPQVLINTTEMRKGAQFKGKTKALDPIIWS